MSPTQPSPHGQAAHWQSLGSLDQFAPGSLSTIKRPPHQLVVARTENGEIFALDNRCPHEGYPLAQGDLKGCALTCCWHNWKFDVRDGACTLGGEDVRSFPLEVRDGEVFCDLAEPEPSQFFPAWKASFNEGLFKHDNGRAIRDGVRLLAGGYPAWDLLADIATQDALHAEYGCGHALAVAADVGRLLPRYSGTRAMYAIAPTLDMAGESNRRQAKRPQPKPIAGATRESVREAIEEEDLERAEALILGAFDAGVARASIDEWLFAALSDHFLSFGHPLIYQIKLQELMAQVDESYARALYAAQTAGIVYGTREDTLPYMQPYANFVREVESQFADVYSSERDTTASDAALDHVRAAVLDGKPREACESVWGALTAGTRPERIAEALVGCAAERLLRFDDSLDRNPDLAENWLWATHRFTFASAVRNALLRFRSPDALRFLFQSVMFTNSGRAMDLEPAARFSRDAAASSASVDDILDAVREHDARRATCMMASYLEARSPLVPLREAIEDRLLEDRPHVRPIVVAHAIKTSQAAFEEFGVLPHERDRETCLLAAVRLLASPLAERRVHEIVRTSIAWVEEGQVRRKLTQ